MSKYYIGQTVKFKSCDSDYQYCEDCESCVADCHNLVDRFGYVHGYIARAWTNDYEETDYDILVRPKLPPRENKYDDVSQYVEISEVHLKPSNKILSFKYKVREKKKKKKVEKPEDVFNPFNI